MLMAKRVNSSKLEDVFFRHMVGNMRNGVLAIDRDGALVLINDEARRLFRLAPGEVSGRPYADVLHEHPDIVRVLGGAFELQALPNRAELRLKSTDTVIGYTLSLVRDDAGEPVGAAMFFKDLTHVEQIEERERLRDRLAAVGEMAAVMAHEIKNPLAGIEVLAGLLRRQVPDNAVALGLVNDIINEAKMANAIVQEVLAFVRPVRLQVDHTSLADAINSAVSMADGKATRGSILVDVALPPDLPRLGADQHQLTQVFCNLLINAYEALEGLIGIDQQVAEHLRQLMLVRAQSRKVWRERHVDQDRTARGLAVRHRHGAVDRIGQRGVIDLQPYGPHEGEDLLDDRIGHLGFVDDVVDQSQRDGVVRHLPAE